MSGTWWDPIVLDDNDSNLEVIPYERFHRNETLREGGAVMNVPQRWVQTSQRDPTYWLYTHIELTGSWHELRLAILLLALFAFWSF